MSEQRGGSMLKLERMRTAFDRAFRNEQNENLKKIEEANNTLETKMDSLISGEIDNVALQTDIEQKLNNLEAEYAPKLTEVSSKLSTKPRVLQSLATIIYDDGYIEELTVSKPYLDTKGITASMAIISSQIGNTGGYFMTATQIKQLMNDGWEVLGHTRTHPDLSTLTTESDRITEIATSKIEIEQALNVKLKGFVYPYNNYNADVIRVTANNYDFAFSRDYTYSKFNTEPLNQYAIHRIQLEDPLSTNKDYIDKCIEKGAWLVFMGHGYNYRPAYTTEHATLLQNAKDNIEYCISRGIEFVSSETAMQTYGNKFAIGDQRDSNEYFLLNENGAVDFKGKTRFIQDLTLDLAADIKSFPKEAITMTYFSNAEVSGKGFPENVGGVLKTIRTSDWQGYGAIQEWYPYNSNNVYKRVYHPVSKWSTFQLQTVLRVENDLTKNGNNRVVSFKNEQITISYFSNAEASDVGLPINGIGGNLVTFRNGGDYGSFQLFIVAQDNRIFKRRWIVSNGGSWGAWARIDNSFSRYQVTPTSVTVPANTSIDVELSTIPSNLSQVVNVTPENGLVNGIILNSFINSSGKVVIRLYNYTSSSITVNRTWNVILNDLPVMPI